METAQEFKEFLSSIEEVNALINSANSLFLQFSGMKDKALSVDPSTEKEEHAQSISTITQEFHSLLSLIEHRIQTLQVQRSTDNLAVSHIQNTHIRGVTDRAQKIVQAFQKEEKEIVKKETERAIAKYLVACPHATQEELEQITDSSRGEALLKAAFLLGDKTQHEAILEAEKRHSTIQHLHSSLKILARTAETLNAIVSQTSQPIDTLSHNLRTMSHSSNASNLNIFSAIKKKKRRRTLKIVFVSVVFILVLFFIVWTISKIRSFFS